MIGSYPSLRALRASPPARALALAHALALALALATLGSCGASRTGPSAVLAIDEAFAAGRPLLVAELAGDASLGGGRGYRPLSLAEGPGRALDAVAAIKAKSPGRVVLVASPLVAAALLGGGSWAGDPALVIAEWRSAGADGASPAASGSGAAFSLAASDPAPAYARAGAACGAYVAALAAEGAAPACGVLFSSSPERPRNALESFQAAFVEKAGAAALIVRELASPGPDAASSAPQDAEAETAVAELLGADLRVLFLAAGAAVPAALRAAARPGIAIGADYPLPEAPAALAFRVSPDEKAMAAALRALAKSASAGSASAIAVPYALTELPGASAFASGGRNLGAYIRETAGAGGAKR